MIKSIDTHYKGYKFRSRLEARWAVFFDTLGLKWEYEKEGFEFNDGTRYLPDFWLSEVKMWAEVKPEEFNTTELVKVHSLAKETGFPVLKLIGVPENKSYEAIGYSTVEKNFFITEYCLTNHHNEGRFYCNPGEETQEQFDASFPDIRIAVNAARSKRFEFGSKD